jgi:hypothetical protein
MIAVRVPLMVEPDPRGGWELILWAGEPFDFTTPFRAMLSDIAVALSRHVASSVRLPAFERNEDFVVGTLQFGDETVRTYYEHSLGYLSLTSDHEGTLRRIAAHIEPLVTVTEDLHQA